MAEPEADAQQLLYNTYGYTGYPYNYNYAHTYTYGGYHPYTYGKREAEAEPEADPALIYTNTLPLTSAVHHSPLVYTTGVHQPIVYNTPVQTPVVYNSAIHTPVVYNTAVKTPLVYNTAVHTPLLKTVDHAVVPSVGGYIHSSHVGVCTNNLGVRVQC